VGLLLFGSQNRVQRAFEADFGRGVRGVWERMKSWFQGNF
jgi:cell division protein FtsA